MKSRMGLPWLRNLAAGPRTWHSKARAPIMCCCSAPFLGDFIVQCAVPWWFAETLNFDATLRILQVWLGFGSFGYFTAFVPLIACCDWNSICKLAQIKYALVNLSVAISYGFLLGDTTCVIMVLTMLNNYYIIIAIQCVAGVFFMVWFSSRAPRPGTSEKGWVKISSTILKLWNPSILT